MRRLLTRILVGAVAVVVIAALPVRDAHAKPIGITKTADLKFGSVIVDNFNPGTVAISSAGVLTCGAPLSCFGSNSAAAFSVTGNKDAFYNITLPGSATVTNGANTMTVDTFEDSKGGVGQLPFAPQATDNFTVGARLNVGAGQPAGSYTGTFTVTVNYQ